MLPRPNYPDPQVGPEQYALAGMLLPEDPGARRRFGVRGLSPYMQGVGIPENMYLGNIFSGISLSERLCDWPVLRQIPWGMSIFLPCQYDEVPILARHYIMQGKKVRTWVLDKRLVWDGVAVESWYWQLFDFMRDWNPASTNPGAARINPAGAVCRAWLKWNSNQGLTKTRRGADIWRELSYPLRALCLFVIEEERFSTKNGECPSPPEQKLINLLQQDALSIHQQVQAATLLMADPETVQFIKQTFPPLPADPDLRRIALERLQEVVEMLRNCTEWLREFIRDRSENGVPLVTDDATRGKITELRTNPTPTVVLVPLPPVTFEQPASLNGAVNILFTHVRLWLQNVRGWPVVWGVGDESLSGFNSTTTLPSIMNELPGFPMRDMGFLVALHVERLMTLQYNTEVAKHVFWACGIFVGSPGGPPGFNVDEWMYRSGKSLFQTEARSLAVREWWAFSGMNFSEGETIDWVWFPQSAQTAFRATPQNADYHKIAYGVQAGIHVLPFIPEQFFVEDPAAGISDGQTARMLNQQGPGGLDDAALAAIVPQAQFSPIGTVLVPDEGASKAMRAAAHRLRVTFPLLQRRVYVENKKDRIESIAFGVTLAVGIVVAVVGTLLHWWH